MVSVSWPLGPGRLVVSFLEVTAEGPGGQLTLCGLLLAWQVGGHLRR